MTQKATRDGDAVAARDAPHARAKPGAVWLARLAGFGGPCIGLGAWIAMRDVPEGRQKFVIVLAVGLVLLGATLAVGAFALVRTRRAARASGASPERTLGRPYTVWIGPPDGVAVWELRVTADAVEWKPLQVGSPWAAHRPGRVALADVVLVVSRPSRVEIVSERDGRPSVLEVRTATYADRQRLLWELAVRVPDAVEKGIPHSSDVHAPRAAAVEPALPARPPGEPSLATRSPSEPIPNARSTEIGAGIDGIGSALAGPSDREQRAPPRSGLGCGLFARGAADDAEDRT